jgi:hypothetical protein
MSNRTLIDIELAKLYFEVLVELAKTMKGQTIEYGQLVEIVKQRFSQSPYISSALAVNMGRRLDALREFTAANQLPDLSSLVVNKATGDNGDGFKKSFDGEAVRRQVAEFDWNSVRLEFDDFLANQKLELEQRQKSRALKKIKEPEALEIWWNYYKDNKSSIPNITQADKSRLVNLIMQRIPPDQALEMIQSPQTKAPKSI